MADKPETIFKYQALTLQTLRNIKSQSVYFGSPKNFNDPYDSAITATVSDLTSDGLRQALDAMMIDPETPEPFKRIVPTLPPDQQKEQLLIGIQNAVNSTRDDYLANNGVTCFSECNDNLLLWSHYGGQYRGLCLEFRTEHEPFNKLRQVQYSDTMPEIDSVDFLTTKTFEQIMKLLCTKSECWEYEREWRAIHRVAGTLFTYKPSSLKAIYFGPDIDRDDIEIVCLIIKGQNSKVELYSSTRSEIEFKVEFKKFEYTSFTDSKRMGIA